MDPNIAEEKKMEEFCLPLAGFQVESLANPCTESQNPALWVYNAASSPPSMSPFTQEQWIPTKANFYQNRTQQK